MGDLRDIRKKIGEASTVDELKQLMTELTDLLMEYHEPNAAHC
jgi:hypothetical protein